MLRKFIRKIIEYGLREEVEIGYALLDSNGNDMDVYDPLYYNPMKETVGSMGIDIRYLGKEDITLAPGERIMLPLNIRLETPSEFGVYLHLRSSISKLVILLNSTGVIDSDYRGMVRAPIKNHTTEPITIESFERIGQLVIHRNLPVKLVQKASTEMEVTKRGTGGFGSTGRH